jgi:hypothetical protein
MTFEFIFIPDQYVIFVLLDLFFFLVFFIVYFPLTFSVSFTYLSTHLRRSFALRRQPCRPGHPPRR